MAPCDPGSSIDRNKVRSSFYRGTEEDILAFRVKYVVTASHKKIMKVL
ncbi:MAG: hypothetical protein ACE5R6_14285 [Candidatus Heimdallarchaeota archaeon]